MADEVIIPVKVDTKDLDNSLNGLNKRLSDLKKQWASVEIGSKAFKDLKKQIDATEKSIKKAGGSVNQLGEITNTIIPGMEGLTSITRDLNMAFNLLVENPLLTTFAAIAGAAVVVIKAFGDTMDGAVELAGFTNQLSEVWQDLKELLAGVGKVVASVLLPILSTLIGTFDELIKFIKNNSDLLKDLTVVVLSGAAAYGVYTAVMEAAAIKSVILSTLTKAQGVATAIMATITDTATGSITAMSVAQGILNAVMDANPIGAVIVVITALVAIVVAAYEKSETFRGIVEGVISVFKNWSKVGKDVIDILAGIGEAIYGIITLDPAKIKEGLDKAAKAGRDIGETFEKGYQDGVNAIKAKNKDQAKKDQYDAEAEGKRFKKLQEEKDKLLVDESDLRVKLAKLKLKAQQGDKSATAEAEKAEKDYNERVLKNQQGIVDFYNKKKQFYGEDKQVVKDAQQAQIELNNLQEKGFQDKLKISRAETKLNKKSTADKNKQNADERKALEELKKKTKTDQDEMEAAHLQSLNDELKDSQAYYESERDNLQEELKFLDSHYKQLGMSDGEYAKKRVELEGKLSQTIINISKKEYEDKIDLDEVAIIEAGKNLDKKYVAEKKKLDDELEYELKQEGVSQAKIDLLKAKHNDDVKKLDEERTKAEQEEAQKRIDAALSEDKEKMSLIENEVKLGKNSYSNLLDAAQKYHDDRAKLLKEAYDKQYKLLEAQGKSTAELDKNYNLEVADNDQKLTDKRIEINQKWSDSKLKTIEEIETVLSAFGKKNKEIAIAEKALAIATTYINTFEAATKAMAKSGNPAAAIPPTILGLANVAKIIATKIPGGDSGGGSKGQSTAQPAQPAEFSAPQLFGIGGQKITDTSKINNQPTKVIVTQQDITRQQNIAQNIKRVSVQGS